MSSSSCTSLHLQCMRQNFSPEDWMQFSVTIFSPRLHTLGRSYSGIKFSQLPAVNPPPREWRHGQYHVPSSSGNHPVARQHKVWKTKLTIPKGSALSCAHNANSNCLSMYQYCSASVMSTTRASNRSGATAQVLVDSLRRLAP